MKIICVLAAESSKSLMKNILFLITLLLLFACKKESKINQSNPAFRLVDQEIKYALGLYIENHKTYKKIKVTAPWSEATKGFTYILYPKGTTAPNLKEEVNYIEVPVEKVIATSTTDIPVLEFLGVEQQLVGFPHTDYISSVKTRKLVDAKHVKELGNNGNLNTELTLELNPDLIIGYSATGDIKTYDLLKRTGIPVVMNGSWTEQHPLGRAEWIKFTAAFFNKEKEADSIFNHIETAYKKAVTLAKNQAKPPTILSGSLYKDVWYVPGGNSYMARFLKDANTNYLWSENPKTGSLALSFESVFEKGKDADIWIGSGNENSLAQLKATNHNYNLFNSFKNKNVYSSTLKKGAKGGFVYYELGPMRPDLILKDIIRIAHPELLPNYEPYFFEKLN